MATITEVSITSGSGIENPAELAGRLQGIIDAGMLTEAQEKTIKDAIYAIWPMIW